jgi:hypothetical protein
LQPRLLTAAASVGPHIATITVYIFSIAAVIDITHKIINKPRNNARIQFRQKIPKSRA